MTRDAERVKLAEAQLDDTPQDELRLKLNDVVASQKALLNKRNQLADLQSRL